MPYFHLGYGYPIFNFYAPGATHVGAWLHLFGFNVVTAYTLTTVFAWCIGSVGVWILARTYLPASAACLACILWVYAPSRFYEFWWQGSLAQIVSTSFIPLLFYGILRTRRNPNLRNGLWIALPTAAIVLTHTPTTYIVSILVLPFCLASAFCSKSRRVAARRLLFIGIGLAMGAGLSAIFWLPVAAELRYVRIGSELRDTVDFLRHRFLSLNEIVSLPQIIDSNDATLLMSRTLGFVGAVLSGLGAVALIIRRRFGLATLLLAGFVASILLTLELSLEFWLVMPGLRNLRFPERFIRLAALFVAMLGASSLLSIPARWRTLATLAMSALVIGQALPFMHPRDDDKVWLALSAKDEIEMEYAEYNWGTTAYNEFLPNWGTTTSFDLPEDLESYITSPLQIHVYAPDFERNKNFVSYQYQADNQILVTISGKALTLRLRQFYLPGWQLTVDGKSYPFYADERLGLIQVHLPEGIHLLQLDYVGTPIQRLAAVISLASVGACVLIFWRSLPSPRLQESDNIISKHAVILASGGIIVFAAVNSAWLQDTVFRTTRVDGKPVYMRQDAGITFDGAITLLGYTLSSNAISDSEPIHIRLYWQREAAPTSEYQPVAQLVDLAVTDAWAVSQPYSFEGGKMSALVAGQFMSDGHILKLFHDAPAFVGRISVQLIRKGDGGSMAELPDGSNRYLLPEVIRINRLSEAFRGRSREINFGGFLTLHCIDTERSANEFNGIFHWEVLEQPPLDYHHFVHGLNERQALVSQNDGVPLDGFYPTSLWRKAQYIQSKFTLNLVEGVSQVAIGLYNPQDGKRIPVVVDGRTTDRILLVPDNASC